MSALRPDALPAGLANGIVRKIFGTVAFTCGFYCQFQRSNQMKIATAIAISAAILATGVTAQAATKDRNAALAQREASCKAQAAKKYSAIRFLARRDYVNKCMGQNAQAKAIKPKAKKSGKAA
jgi:hypothetical protein